MMINCTGLTRAALAALLCVAVVPTSRAFAQSLGDVAKRTEEQRKAASKVYTNGNLPAVEPPPTQAAAMAETTEPEPVVAAPASGFTVTEDPATGQTNKQTAPAESRRNEQYWRKTLGDVRAKIAALNQNIASQQARLDQVQGDSPTASRERDVISGTIERLQKDVDLQNGELTRWLALAAASKAPQEWLK